MARQVMTGLTELNAIQDTPGPRSAGPRGQRGCGVFSNAGRMAYSNQSFYGDINLWLIYG